MKLTIPYLKLRGGRPRWEPGPGLRAAGFSGRDLKDSLGNWLSDEAAIEAARALNAEVDDWRKTGAKKIRTRATAEHPRSCKALVKLYTGLDFVGGKFVDDGKAETRASPKWKKLAASTKGDYLVKLRLFLLYQIEENSETTFGAIAVGAVAHHHLYRLWEMLFGERGHAMANGMLRVVSVLFSHARRVGWRLDNPATKLDMEGLEPRVVVWSPSEIAEFVKTADEMGLYSVADAVIVALHTVQRRGDVLALEMPAIAGERSVFRQSKTGARVSVPYTPPLAERINIIKARRRQGKVVEIEAPGQRVILDEKGRPYEGQAGAERFGKAFREVRAAVAAKRQAPAPAGHIGHNEGPPLLFPDIDKKTFQDLRDTGITRLALAGCTVPEIRAISGHMLATVHAVLRHYLALDDRMADAAIAKLKLYMAEEGIAI